MLYAPVLIWVRISLRTTRAFQGTNIGSSSQNGLLLVVDWLDQSSLEEPESVARYFPF